MSIKWIIGIFTLWIFAFLLVSVVELNATPYAQYNGGSVMELIKGFFNLKAMNWGEAAIILLRPWDFFLGIIKVIFLWFPSLWTGVYYYFWLIFCMPLGVGVCVSIASVLRGVHST